MAVVLQYYVFRPELINGHLFLRCCCLILSCFGFLTPASCLLAFVSFCYVFRLLPLLFSFLFVNLLMFILRYVVVVVVQVFVVALLVHVVSGGGCGLFVLWLLCLFVLRSRRFCDARNVASTFLLIY